MTKSGMAAARGASRRGPGARQKVREFTVMSHCQYSIQNHNNAVIARHAEDLRRLCGMTSYARALAEAVAVRGLGPETVPQALSLLGLPRVTATGTLLADGRGWVSRVVHYHDDRFEVARWLGGRELLLVLRCPRRRFAPYELAATA